PCMKICENPAIARPHLWSRQMLLSIDINYPAIHSHFIEETPMATLVVIGYENEIKAEEVRLALLKMQQEYLIDLVDAVVAVRDSKGKVRLRQLYNLTAAGAASGGFWGALVGLIFLNPLFGFAIGAAAGAISGASNDVGIG